MLTGARHRIIDRHALCELFGIADDKRAALQNEWMFYAKEPIPVRPDERPPE